MRLHGIEHDPPSARVAQCRMNSDSAFRLLRGFPRLDSDAIIAVLTRGIQGGVMAAGAAAVIWRMTPVDQGFYFAFISFGIMLQLCDFGLSYATLQSASHMAATGRASQIAPLGATALRINVLGTLAAWAIVAILGWSVFSATGSDVAREVDSAWRWPWIVFISGVAFNHFTAPSIFLVEGGVSVAAAWRFRMIQEVISGAALIIVLALGLGLWALAAYYWTRFAMTAWWMRSANMPRYIDAEDRLRDRFSLAKWHRDVWPFQWRVGVSAIAGYLVFQAFSPIFFALQGPTAAGRFALSLSVMNALVMVTTAWPISQAAHFGGMLGRRETDALSARLTQLLFASTAFAVISAIAAFAALFALDRFEPKVAARFADLGTSGFLIASAIVHHVVACLAVVLRSERRDPLLWLSVAGGAVTVACMTIVAATSTARGIALAYLVCTALGLPIAYAIFRKFAQRHGLDAASARRLGA